MFKNKEIKTGCKYEMKSNNCEVTGMYYKLISEHMHVNIHLQICVHTHPIYIYHLLITYYFPVSTLEILCIIKLCNSIVDSNTIIMLLSSIN